MAVVDDEIVGGVTLAVPGNRYAEIGRPDELEVRMLAVAEAARGQGIAALLMDATEARARQLDLPAVVLCTAPRCTRPIACTSAAATSASPTATGSCRGGPRPPRLPVALSGPDRVGPRTRARRGGVTVLGAPTRAPVVHDPAISNSSVNSTRSGALRRTSIFVPT